MNLIWVVKENQNHNCFLIGKVIKRFVKTKKIIILYEIYIYICITFHNLLNFIY